jgi:hypothetical protein
MTQSKLILSNIIIAIANGFACGFNTAIVATGNSHIPALTGGLIAVNAGVAIWIAKRTFNRVVLRGDDASASDGAASSSRL